VYAAGDVASWFHVGYGRRMRLEHRMNATEQGAAAATNLLNGSCQPFVPIPYFWTDHYDTKIQVHGVIPPGVAPVVVEGDLSAERFTVLYQDSGGVHALLTWNNPKSARHYRQELSVVKDATPSTGDNHDRSHALAPR
jgi:NADPH-dependent 2,4-dienoyl-CoA reductase/sulfur reductase-like enzyme